MNTIRESDYEKLIEAHRLIGEVFCFCCDDYPRFSRFLDKILQKIESALDMATGKRGVLK